MNSYHGDKFHISSRRLLKFGKSARDEWFLVHFDEKWHGQRIADMLDNIHGLFEKILQRVREQGIRDRDLVRVHIRHPDILQHGDVTVSLRPMEEMNAGAIVSALENVLQSADNLMIDSDFEIAVGSIKLVHAGIRTKISSVQGLDCSLALKKSVVIVHNTDKICLARALVICRAFKQISEETTFPSHPSGSMDFSGRSRTCLNSRTRSGS